LFYNFKESMGEKLIVGPVEAGVRTNRTAFFIDNDSFPTINNAYQWRGRIKRKRGTQLLTRFQREITLDSALIGGSITLSFPVVPGTISITGSVDGTTYTDTSENGTLTATGGTGTGGTINYATGVLTITGGAEETVTGTYSYYPCLPVMGLEEYIAGVGVYPGTIGFDTTYAYRIPGTYPYTSYNITFYKNPSTDTYTGYVAKTTDTSFTWNGQNYQQFWTTNYQNSLWATNGITVPYTTTNVGMQFKAITSVTVDTTTTASLTINAHGLVIGDFLFINEVTGTTGINLQTGYVTAVTSVNVVVVTFPNASLSTNGTGGIAQYLTNTALPLKDCIRWYDGDPTTTNNGWVNFAPPLSSSTYSIADNPEGQYYLVGARLIYPFKDRLLFFGAIIQTSTGTPIYCQDTIIYSQNGTPYYTASFTGTATSSTTVFNPILVPENQSATASSWFEDSTGFGGFYTLGLDQPIITVAPNEDVLLLGFNPNFQARLVYTGNDLIPFNLFIVNSEFGSSSTFSSITLDKGVLTRSSRGFTITSQTGSQRFDLQIPDTAFEISLTNNGPERICAIRNFEEEWVYFTYISNQANTTNTVFPNLSLFYNYRDDSFSFINESYTTYGQFRKVSGITWATLPANLTWSTWTTPWNSNESTLLNQQVIGGNQQGFVLIKDIETAEAPSLYISALSGITITSPYHQLINEDFITISGCIGVEDINGNIYKVFNVTANTFMITNPSSGTVPSGTYLGGGVITKAYVPFIKTKQFPISWEMARKTRIGFQQYLFTNSNVAFSQIALLIFLSQNDSTNITGASNFGPIVPSEGSVNNALIYSTVLYTCPESTNIGLTPSNVNLNMVTANNQQQIWHRINTSLLGDTVQIGFTIADEQMYMVDANNSPINAFTEIELHAFVLDVQPSQLLS